MILGPNGARRGLLERAGLSAGFHVFGLLWTQDAYTFYVDGEATWRSEQAVSHRPEYMILSLEVGDWAGDVAGAQLPDALVVDYVRVFQEPAR